MAQADTKQQTAAPPAVPKTVYDWLLSKPALVHSTGGLALTDRFESFAQAFARVATDPSTRAFVGGDVLPAQRAPAPHPAVPSRVVAEQRAMRVFDLALSGGYGASDRLGYAFMGGYQCALVHLLQRCGAQPPASLVAAAAAVPGGVVTSNSTGSGRGSSNSSGNGNGNGDTDDGDDDTVGVSSAAVWSAGPVCLCATEKVPGAPPSSIHTTLALDVVACQRASARGDTARTFWRLDGRKSFVTGGTHGRWLAIVARQVAVTDTEVAQLCPAQRERLERDAAAYQARRQGAGGGSGPRIRLVLVDAATAGVHVVDRPSLPFIPEIPHGRVTLERVSVACDDFFDAPGSGLDGYTDFVKAFRTVEDAHINAAVCGYVLRLALTYPHWFVGGPAGAGAGAGAAAGVSASATTAAAAADAKDSKTNDRSGSKKAPGQHPHAQAHALVERTLGVIATLRECVRPCTPGAVPVHLLLASALHGVQDLLSAVQRAWVPPTTADGDGGHYARFQRDLRLLNTAAAARTARRNAAWAVVDTRTAPAVSLTSKL